MSCEQHDWRTVSGAVLAGAPTRAEQVAWCRTCGALRSQLLTGWGVTHPLADPVAPKLLNIPRIADAPRGSDMRYGETCGHRTPDGACTRPATHHLRSKYGVELDRGCEACMAEGAPDGSTILELPSPVAVSVRMESERLVVRLADRRVVTVEAAALGGAVASSRLGERRVVTVVDAGLSVRWPLLEQTRTVREILAGPHEGSR